MRLSGAVALVTGGTAGIGLAIAKRLVSEGASVFICSRKQSNVDTALAELSALADRAHGSSAAAAAAAAASPSRFVAGVAQHVGDTAAQAALVKAVIARFGKLDILVSNVATNPTFGPMLDTDELVWDKIFATNVKAMFTLARVCVPHLRESTLPGGGNVLIVTSIGGFAPMPMLGAYSVSKTALIGLTKALAGELGPLGVRVNALAPGIVRTNFSAALWKGGDSNAIAQTAVRAVPLGRFAEADEMGGPAAFLVSPDASYVTGEVLIASGGMQSRL